MDWLFATLRKYPELAIFLTLGVGYWIGSKKFGTFSLGAVTGTLLVGVVVGQLNITINPIVKQVFFLMFLFAIGYGVGPQFFRGMKKDGLPQVAFAVLLCVFCLVATWLTAVVFGFDTGTAAGLVAGAQTISAVIGVATDTINTLPADAAQKKAWIDHIPVAYAVAYIFGTAGSAWILSTIGPKLLGVDLAAVCKEYEAKMSGGADSMMLTAYRVFTARTYRLRDAFAGKRVDELERAFKDTRVFVQRVRRANEVIEAEPALVLQSGDVVALSGRHEVLAASGVAIAGGEVEDRDLLAIPVQTLEVVLTSKDVAGKTIGELAASDVGREFARGVYLRRVVRAGIDMPVNAGLMLDRGDHVYLVGATKDVERVANKVGYVDRATDQTDMVFVGIGILLGGLIGSLALRVKGIPISLSTSGGALIMGLVFGWLRSVRPTFGRVPAPVHWFLTSVG